MSLDFTLADVFSDEPFGGNQLAVFPDAAGISDADMQRLAREFNFSETTFVLPPSDPSCTHQVRIFTPGQELPFAGHPIIGTAAVLASADGPDPAEGEFVFEEEIGPVAVTVDGSGIRFCLRPAGFETTDEVPPAAAIARALKLPADAIAEAWYAAVGLRFCFIRLSSPQLVDRIVLDKAAWAAGVAGGWSSQLYCFAGDFHAGEWRDGAGRLHARFFAPAIGVEEDPATGSASAALAASVAHRSPEPDGSYSIQIDQGVLMGRPSKLAATAYKEGGEITQVVVSGNAVIVGHGTMSLPAGSAPPAKRAH
jgi:trans-2,3-dihydro-3-hydroxyanthranilate isomerase